MMCTPRAPACLSCPVVELCATRGELAGSTKPPRQKKREIHYALDCRNGSVFLVQRAPDARLMAGMWELPQLTPEAVNGDAPLFRVRHSITDTDYHVSVFAISEEESKAMRDAARWFTTKQYGRLALTGLTRKILRRVLLESKSSSALSK